MQRRDFLAASGLSPFLQRGLVARSTAEALGYAPDQKLLMVHADDVGMSHTVNVATVEALRVGMVASGSIMMPCPWVNEIASYCREHPEADLGLHLTLTSEWKRFRWRPLAPSGKVPGLQDPEGCLWRDVRSVAAHASPEEVEIELRAQIDAARKLGIRFTHLDTHMGTLFARPEYFELYTKLARLEGVPCMLPRPRPELKPSLAGYPVTLDMLEAKQNAGWVTLDYLSTGVSGSTVEQRYKSYDAFLSALSPGVTKLIVHLAMDDPEIRAITDLWEQRYADFRYFTDPETRKKMDRLNIRTITYRELSSIAYK
jgi:predicted glycoside hydrolase/deacetylase ChbG (UPF0249 family)